jgi:hypothetical protein
MDEVEFLPEPAPLPARRRAAAQPAADARLFERRESTVLFGVLKIIAGVLVIGFAAVMFVFHLVTQSSQIVMQATTTLPMLLGFGLISAGVSSLRGPSHVAADAQGIVVARGQSNRRIGWSDIGLASAGSSPLSYRRRLSLFAPDGKLLDRIPNNFPDFEQLVQLAQDNVEQRTAGTSESLRLQKSRKHLFWMVPFACIMAAASIGIAWHTWETERGRKLLESSGVNGDGLVIRRFLAPNGVTCRLEYAVIGDQGQAVTRNAEVEPAYWREIEGKQTVPIRYVPAAPKFSRLLTGEVPSRDDHGPRDGYFLSAAALVLSLFLLAGAATQYLGWDFGKHPKTGKIGFFKLGT